MTTTEQFNLRPHLEAYWLRPECALWDTIAARHLSEVLQGKDGILELGIGNGLFSFLMLGGRITPEFDWFRNVNTAGFWDQADIFNHDAGVAIDQCIAEAPTTRISIGVDHKASLLSQTARLGFVDQLIEHDCNQPLPSLSFSRVYSNMLYWLTDPLSVIHNIGLSLPTGGELVTVFPNQDFYVACESYRRDEPIWKLLNRGRAGHIMWHMEPDEFRREMERAGQFEIRVIDRYLSPLTLKIWDIGLRPLSVPLIKMANSLPAPDRLAVKAEWCDTVEKLAGPLLEHEMETGKRTGGFNLVVLVKKP